MSFNVHSVFDNTINLVNDIYFVALSHENSSLTPMSINLAVSPDYFKSLDLKQGDEVRIDQGGLHWNTYDFELSGSQGVNLAIPKVDSDHFQDFIDKLNAGIDAFLRDKGKGLLSVALKFLHSGPESENLHIQAFKKRFKALYASEKPQKIKDSLKSFLGLGEGLTPSGDDMITGVFASLYALRDNDSLHSFLIKLKNEMELLELSTTDVSKSYLKYAFRGHFNEHVKALVNAYNNHEPLTPHINRIGDLGHSSGTDFIIGLKIGLYIGGIIHDS